jgi:hypothetical protein
MKVDVWLVDVVEKGDLVRKVVKWNDGEGGLVLSLAFWGVG